jgi:hypothetical protein
MFVLFLTKYHIEPYGQGALVQLTAKGPQDTYLTGDADKYLWWNYPGWVPGDPYPWYYYVNPSGRKKQFRYAGIYPYYWREFEENIMPVQDTIGH